MAFEAIIVGIGIPIVLLMFGWLWWLKGSASKSSARIGSVEKSIERLGQNVKAIECNNSVIETRIKSFIDDRDKSILLKFDRTDAKIDDLKNSLHSISESLAVLRTNSENSSRQMIRLAELLDQADEENDRTKERLTQVETELKITRRSA
jgi:chromosome segregation ATPase